MDLNNLTASTAYGKINAFMDWLTDETVPQGQKGDTGYWYDLMEKHFTGYSMRHFLTVSVDEDIELANRVSDLLDDIFYHKCDISYAEREETLEIFRKLNNELHETYL